MSHNKSITQIYLIVLLLFLSLINLEARVLSISEMKQSVKVFYDGSGTLFNYLRTDIDFVQFVRSPTEAHVHIQINSITTGDGGKEYTLFFMGIKEFTGIDDTLVTFTAASLSDNERFVQLVRLVKQGLVRYISKTSDNKNIDIVYTGNVHNIPVDEKWDNWIFSIGLNSSIEGEESKKEFMWEADLDVDRIKKGSKIKINGTYSNEIKEFENDNEVSQTSKKERIFRLLYVNSISRNFSAGIFNEYKSRTYENIKDGLNIAPALEYSVYPYEQSVRKKFTFLYRVGWIYNNYYERTIFSKDEESLFQQSLKIDYTIYELWGKADIFLEASHYLNDFNKNRIDFETKLAFRLSGSFFFNIYLQASYVNDQLYIPLEDASFEDVLLNQIKLSTQYEYRLKLGVSYTFGSIYNTIVNPRF